MLLSRIFIALSPTGEMDKIHVHAAVVVVEVVVCHVFCFPPCVLRSIMAFPTGLCVAEKNVSQDIKVVKLYTNSGK